MSVLEWLNIGLGIIFVYLVVAISCTAVTDVISSLLGLRWKTLRSGVVNLLGDDETLDKFYDSPILRPFFEGKKMPSRIPAKAFSMFVIDHVSLDAGLDTIVEAKDILDKANLSQKVRDNLFSVLDMTRDTLQNFQNRLETWFDAAMVSVTAWYKRRTAAISLVIALLLAGFSNIDTIAIGQFLSTNTEARAAFADAASDIAKGHDLDNASDELVSRYQQLQAEYKLPIGWNTAQPLGDSTAWISKILGILLTGFAASLGAPFWFDILSRLSELRQLKKKDDATNS